MTENQGLTLDQALRYLGILAQHNRGPYLEALEYAIVILQTISRENPDMEDACGAALPSGSVS